MKKIIIFADGGVRGNQYKENIGGWGVLLTYEPSSYIKEIYGCKMNTTNNIMELTSCIKGLGSIKDKTIPVEVVMDSQYVISGINQWMASWIVNNWKTARGDVIKNIDLWKELYRIISTFKNITFTKCKGHDFNFGNNRADELANLAMDELEEQIRERKNGKNM
jgi:ribonuclease HI